MPPPTGEVPPEAAEGVSEGGYCLWEPRCGRPWVSGPLGGARGVLVPGGHRPGPTEAAAETGAPPRRGVARGAFPLRGDTKGGLPPFENTTPEQLPTPVSPAGSVGSRQSAAGARSPPSRAHTFVKEGAALAWEGEKYSIYLISKGELALPLWNPRREQGKRKMINLFGNWGFCWVPPQSRRWGEP